MQLSPIQFDKNLSFEALQGRTTFAQRNRINGPPSVNQGLQQPKPDTAVPLYLLEVTSQQVESLQDDVALNAGIQQYFQPCILLLLLFRGATALLVAVGKR